MSSQKIILKNVKVHNLKGVDLTLDPGLFYVFTGVSGSGKTSLAFDTIYVEGQRRYIESLSAYARRHLGDFPSPDADLISGISPTVAIEQKTAGRNPRSTVGTMTGIYDFLRVLYARIGVARCPISGEAVAPQSLEQILRQIWKMEEGSKLIVLAPHSKAKKATFKDEFEELLRRGYTRVRLDGEIISLDDPISVDGSIAHDLDIVIDRLVLRSDDRSRITDTISSALQVGDGVISVYNVTAEKETLFSTHAFAEKSGISYPPLEPQDFSFNHPTGMCPTCEGIGETLTFDLSKVIDPEKSIAEDCCQIASSFTTVRYGNIYRNLAVMGKFDLNTPWKELPKKAQDLFLRGRRSKKSVAMTFIHPITGKSWVDYVAWKGVLAEALKKYQDAKSDVYKNKMEKLMHREVCPDCKGDRIAPYPAATTINGVTIGELTRFPISKAHSFLKNLKLSENEQIIAEELLKEITERLHFLNDVGLHYLSIDRTAPTLSGGEAQRVRLASQIGCGLVGATYVLDEPSIGLHPRDNTKLLSTLKKLRDKGNTVIVIEHDEETILAADKVIDVGPHAGVHGGEIVSYGSVQNLLESENSITGQFLSRKEEIIIPKKRRKPKKEKIEIFGATHHNLKNVHFKLPLGVFTAVTGVSGSGKSSLVTDILYPAISNALHNGEHSIGKHEKITGMEHIDKVIAIDQSPIGRTPRSNPSTYTKVFDFIRDLFCQLPESKAKGFKAGRFSFNVKEGSCPHCGGMGMVKVDMDFMEDEWSICDNCEGKRFDAQTLSVLYKGKSIYDVLEMNIEEACTFFENIPHITKKLGCLLDVGLGYIKLGQSSPSLSGGEAQRIKLAKELSRPSTGKTLYILDEPTTGLHFYDIKKLNQILHSLVDKGNSVLVIEHNMDLVKTADQIVDIGPEGGEHGGQIVATGTPEKVSQNDSPTGHAIEEALNPKEIVPSNFSGVEKPEKTRFVSVLGAKQNNLQSVDLSIPREKITVCTGPSGSGKTSFAFDTVYAEGQRRYIESMSAYARQFVKQMAKPKVESVDGLSPAIAIEQKHHAGNPRSTIGTMTEAHDFLRVLYTHLGDAFCPETGEKLQTISTEYVAEKLLELPERTKLHILAKIAPKKSEAFEDLIDRLQKEGYIRIRLDGEYYELDDEIPYDRGRKHKLFLVVDRMVVTPSAKKRVLEAIENATKISGGTLVADHGQDLFFNLAFAAPSTGKSYPKLTPHTFSFNTDKGMCFDCLGLGFQYGANLLALPDVLEMSPVALLYAIWKEKYTREAEQLAIELFKKEGIDPLSPIKELGAKARNTFFMGSEKFHKVGKSREMRWIGINEVLAKTAKSGLKNIRLATIPLLDQVTCHSCKGSRLNPLASAVKLSNLTMQQFCALPIGSAFEVIEKLKVPKELGKVLHEPLEQLKHRLRFLCKIGLHYLSLDRSAPTLSNGETQRIQLARQLGTGLTGCLYVLDEPTIGLHPHNNTLLNNCLQELKNLGNTLLLVEHDPLTVNSADYLVDFGPKAGKFGGEVIAQGTLPEIMSNPSSLTGQYLSGKRKIEKPKTRRSFTKCISIKNGNQHNLKNIDVDIPLGIFTTITGVSGSGKSTLMQHVLKPALQRYLVNKRDKPKSVRLGETTVSGFDGFHKLIVIDQNPIGHTIRANVSTYTDVLTPIRHHFADLREAKKLGLKSKHFSFNHLRGMCRSCWGLGTKTIEMQFLPPVKVTCESCNGNRLNAKSLQVKYQDKHLGQILKMNVVDAREHFKDIPKVAHILDTLISVGLDYLHLDQAMQDLSGGEQQRIRLSRELAKKTRGKTLYLFDEPTVGLHNDDIAKLLPIFQGLVDKGHSIIAIEHNTDFIENSDYLIDMGPEAGQFGGEVIGCGTPEELKKVKKSHTAKYLFKS